MPLIIKASRVAGRTLNFRDACINDADFIISLCLNKIKSRYLNVISADYQKQAKWIEAYANSQIQAYFIIGYQNEPIGTVRLYDAIGKSFCWGSWILIDGQPSHAAIDSALDGVLL